MTYGDALAFLIVTILAHVALGLFFNAYRPRIELSALRQENARLRRKLDKFSMRREARKRTRRDVSAKTDRPWPSHSTPAGS